MFYFDFVCNIFDIQNVPFVAKLVLMSLQHRPGKLLATVIARSRKFADGFFHGQVSASGRPGQFNAATWTAGHLVPQSSICENVREAASAQQMSIGTLQIAILTI